ncbi:MAG: hypothetical protein AAF485_27970 [Chloroflexota bacterium]
MEKRIFWGIIILSLILFCGIIPLPGELTGLFVGSFLFIATVVGWPIIIGPRLHERSWQTLAQNLGLTYHPRNSLEKGTPATVTGLHLNRQIKLTTSTTPRGGRSAFELVLTIEVKNPNNNGFTCHKLGKIDMRVNRTLGDAGTGNADFDRVFIVEQANPEDLVTDLLTHHHLGQAISRMAKGSRVTSIALQEKALSFREECSSFSGVETDLERLRFLVEAMYDFAEAIDQT